MRSDAACPNCGRPIRRAIHAATHQPVLLEPRADLDGRYGVVDFQQPRTGTYSTPIVAMNPTRDVIPTRYNLHRCDADATTTRATTRPAADA